MLDYQTNTDMAFPIRLALAQFADVVTNAEVLFVKGNGAGAEITIQGRDPLPAGRIIDARGLGDPQAEDVADGTAILTFPQFMQRMTGTWPLRGVRRVAVVSGGDSAKCAVESLLGIAPQPPMAAAALDSVERIDWYSDRLPTTCEDWQQEIRGRYQAIGRQLRPDRLGVRRPSVVRRRVRPVALPRAALIDGRMHDLAVVRTGFRETSIDELEFNSFQRYAIPDEYVVALKHTYLPAFRIGPHTQPPFTQAERSDGVADIAANAVAMFRTAAKTAALAARFPRWRPWTPGSAEVAATRGLFYLAAGGAGAAVERGSRPAYADVSVGVAVA